MFTGDLALFQMWIRWLWQFVKKLEEVCQELNINYVMTDPEHLLLLTELVKLLIILDIRDTMILS